MRRFFFLQNSPVDCFAKPKELTELETGRSQFVRAGVQRVQPFVHGYRECNTPVQVKGGSLAQLSGVSPLSTGYYLTQKAARNQLRCPSPLSGKSKRKGGIHVKLTRHNGRAGKNGVYNPKHNDRSFDIANSEHIDEERAKQNLYWDCYNGFRNFKNPDKENELSATFEDVEQLFYRQRYDRAFYILAITVCQADWDRRYSPDNRAWANAMSIPANPDAWGTDRNCYLAVSSHPGLVDLFLSQTRKAYAQERQKTSVRDKLKKPPETTSPKISAKSKAPER